MEPDLSISLNPPASTPHLVVLFIVLAVAFGWFAWRSTAQIATAPRVFILLCRVLLAGALLAIALNPGRWIEKREETRQFWTVLADQSLSMKTDDVEENMSRWEKAVDILDQVESSAPDLDQVEWFTFDSRLHPQSSAASEGLEPVGDNTDLPAAGDALLTLARGRSDRMRGSIVITDGRQTGDGGDHERVALRARAMEAPFYLLPLGGEVKPIDLSVKPTRRQFVAFEGQDAIVTASVEALGLGAIRPEVTLIDGEGNELERQQVELAGEEAGEVRFTFPAPEPGVHLMEFSTEAWPEEKILANNTTTFTVTVLDGTTRIFMAEGAPYWDTKFLAQMIREQEKMEITSVSRLTEDRFFRVATGDDRPTEQSENTFPSTADELAEYDLIAFGKGAEYFLDEKRLALLSEYVRDRGGSVLFTRGKPYRTEFRGLEFLEPVTWGEKIGEPFQLQPTPSGEAAGLFGDLLPGAGDPIWQRLPALSDSHQCLEMKPFTEVMLEGSWMLDGKEQSLPILMSRRFGRGMTITLNADGIWQWDFFPSEKGVEGQYEEFWSQLIQWAITFSEFLPGQDLSLHLDQSIIRPGDLVRARVGYRGETDEENAPAPALALYRDGQLLREIPAAKPNPAAVRWEAAINLSEPGAYRVEAINLNNAEERGPSLPITVLPPPSETEQLSADPEFLETFADISGGRIISEADLPDLMKDLSKPEELIDRDKAVWEPLWDRWFSCAMILFIVGMEWFTRRRTGLL